MIDASICACMYQECKTEGRCLAKERAKQAWDQSSSKVDLKKLAELFESAPDEVNYVGMKTKQVRERGSTES